MPISAFGGNLRSVPVEELGAIVARVAVDCTGLEIFASSGEINPLTTLHTFHFVD